MEKVEMNRFAKRQAMFFLKSKISNERGP